MAHKILAVDDHPETLDIVVLTLERHGYQVISSLSPIKALQLAQEELPDLILLDVNMPDMDGLEVCRRLRALPRLANVPIIMFTAEDEPYQKLAGFDAGADDYLTKPTDPDEMLARIEAILGGTDENESGRFDVEPTSYSDKTVVMPSDRIEMPAAAPDGKLVAVVGVRGGSGATLTAINLAAGMAWRSYPTTVVDLDMMQGHISMYLNQQVSGGMNTLADLPEEEIGQWLPQQLIRLSQHLQLLLTQPNQDGRFPLLSSSQTDAILDNLLQSGQNVVVDLGRSPTDAQRQVLERADQVLVCFPPERIALSAARQLLNHFQNTLPPFTTINAIIFDVGDQMSLPRKAVETYLAHSITAVISISPKELTQAVNKGAILVNAFAQGKTAKQFYQLAKQLISHH